MTAHSPVLWMVLDESLAEEMKSFLDKRTRPSRCTELHCPELNTFRMWSLSEEETKRYCSSIGTYFMESLIMSFNSPFKHNDVLVYRLLLMQHPLISNGQGDISAFRSSDLSEPSCLVGIHLCQPLVDWEPILRVLESHSVGKSRKQI